MPTVNCGFSDGYLPGMSGSEVLELVGPTIPVHIGYDPDFAPGPGRIPDLPSFPVAALVDTGAQENCVDVTLATRLSLPLLSPTAIASVSGSASAHYYMAHLYIAELGLTIAEGFTGVRLAESGQPHRVIIGRRFLRYFRLIYDGPTGVVTISND